MNLCSYYWVGVPTDLKIAGCVIRALGSYISDTASSSDLGPMDAGDISFWALAFVIGDHSYMSISVCVFAVDC